MGRKYIIPPLPSSDGPPVVSVYVAVLVCVPPQGQHQRKDPPRGEELLR